MLPAGSLDAEEPHPHYFTHTGSENLKNSTKELLILKKQNIYKPALSVTTKGKVKVKVTRVQALRLCTGRTAHRGSRGIALPFLDHGTERG
jgi:hypothetical protein